MSHADLEAIGWDQLKPNVERIISDSLTSRRVPVLKRIRALVVEKSIVDDDLKTISLPLLKTYNFYQDANSRNELLTTLEAIVHADSVFLSHFIKFIYSQTAAKVNSALALTDYMTLLNWTNKFAILAAELDPSNNDLISSLVESRAAILYNCICSSSGVSKYHLQHRNRVHDSVLSSARTSIVDAFFIRSDEKRVLEVIVSTLVASKLPSDTILVYLGVLSNALFDLSPVKPGVAEYFTENKVQVIEYLSNQVLLAKVAPSVASLEIFGSYVAQYLTEEDLSKTIQPIVDKAILRSSENSFGIVLPIFFKHVSTEINLSELLVNSKLLLSILSAFKSTKENVRSGAFSTLEAIVSKHFVGSSDDSTSKFVNEILKAIKTTTNNDSKFLIAKSLALLKNIAIGNSIEILDGLGPLIVKDQNEISLGSLVGTYILHLQQLIQSDEVREEQLSKFVKQTQTGLSDKKLSLRRIWFCELGDSLYDTRKPNSNLTFLIKTIYPALLKSFDEAQQSPLPTVANKGISAAYVTIALTSIFKDSIGSLDTSKVFEGLLSSNSDKPHILTDAKVYSKLSGEVEFKWALRALKEFASNIENLDQFHQDQFANAWVYFLISSNVPSSQRLYARSLVKLFIASNPAKFSNLLIDSIFLNLKVAADDKRLNFKDLSPLLSTITQIEGESDLIQENLVRVIAIAGTEEIPIKNGWVGLAQRSQSDVANIVKTHHKKIIDSCLQILNEVDTDSILAKGAVKALGVLAFILPEIVSPLLTEIIRRNLDCKRFDVVDSDSLKIWRGPEGQLVVDIFSQGKKVFDDKNSKDYEMKKWEESLKREIAIKNSGTQRKLSKEEQVLANEQLAKESTIRNEVQEVVKTISYTLPIVNQLISGASLVDNGSKSWYPVSIYRLLDLSRNPFLQEVFGNRIIESFLKLSELVSPRLGQLKSFVGVATLRINNVEGLPSNYKDEPLLNLVGRLLFRIKILADQNPLDSISLSYILPLLTKVLQIGKQVAIKNSTKQAVTSEFVNEDQEEEQLLLAIEIIAAHSEAFEDDSIPRDRILEVLLSLMRLPSKSKIAKDCFLSMGQHIAINFTNADLSIFFDNIVIPELFVRTAVLESLDSEFDLHGAIDYSSELWIAAHDNDTNSAEIAATIWEDNDLRVVDDAPQRLLNFSGNKDSGIRLSIAKAIVSAVGILQKQGDSEIFEKTIDSLIKLYHIKKNPPAAALDRFGLVIKSTADQRDTWEERSTIALTLKLLAPFFNSRSIERIFKFFVIEEALGDKEDLVRQELQEAGVEIINSHGSDNVEKLIPIFEENLAAKDQRSKIQDNIKECVIILYGSLARHLDPSDDRLQVIIDRLIKTLSTPSEDVQFAVAKCIAPLTKYIEPQLQEYFDRLFEKLFDGKTYASRRGAAYGIAGLVKGYGIKALSSYDIVRTLTDASDDKKNPNRREGVSIAFECFSLLLGKYFEPYVIEVLPIILKSLGDPVPEVREATDSAAKQIMRNTTSFGVKKLIPLAISNLDEIAWRSKKGSVELLGSMAYLDPTQLSSSLSTIIPEIVGVLNDTHKEVRKAGEQSLKRFGEVIRNPEIQAIVPHLINAIGDPTKYTDDALDKLIKTQFVHYIDGPSLALIIHVIHRGMKERSAATKKKACQIVGNMAILVDSKDLLPYLNELVSELEIAMVDPVPATRSTAARALGSLVERLGEEQFPDLIPRLLDTLQDSSKAGDRLGSAQALSEVICGLGINKLEDLLPTILSNATSPRNHVRAGFVPLLLFLPVCFGSQFAPYLNRIIPPILNGLADMDEDIRETALRAGRLIVKNYAKKAVDLLLPELENGLSDSSYRIRLSSVELTGDLLFQITGISGKNEISEESEFSGEVNKTLVEVLGQERRDRVLSSLFVCRSDVAGIVRNAAVDIWKALVANTPRTVKEILPSLTSIIVRRLASSDETHRTIAANTLGEMVRRVGANALSQLLPTLEESLVSSDSDAKQGICIALTELIRSTQHDGLVEYQDEFIRIIRDSLVDSAPGVREAAAQTFEALQEELGKVVIDEILPHLLTMLESDDSQPALLALQDIMATKSDVIFPILIPSLLSPPIDAFKANALSSLASVAGSALYKRLSLIINTLVNAVIDSKAGPEETQNEIKESFDKILLSIDDDEGVHTLMQQLLALVKHEDAAKRAVIYERLGNFFTHTNLDYSVYLVDMISQFILSLGDKSPEVVQGTFDALSALVKRQPKESLEKLVKPARQALELTGVRGEELAGFKLAKGPSCVLPIFSHGLMYGNSEQKEASALAIADIIDKTPALNLKPFATTITGPLIRVVGEKVLSDIKAAILIALNSLLLKIPQFLRPFIPQLQRTFVRSLSDSTNEVLRARAVVALGTLIEFQPRVDSLVAELVAGTKNAFEQGVKTSMLKGILEVVNRAGKNMSEASKTSVMTLVEDEITLVDDKSAVSYARLIGSLSRILSSEEATNIIKSKILDKPNNCNDKFCVLSINSFLRYSPGHVFHTGILDEIVNFIVNCSDSSIDYVSDNATVAIGKLLILHGESNSPVLKNDQASEKRYEIDEESLDKLVNQIATTAISPVSNSPDTRRLSLVVIRTVARFQYELIVKPNWDILAPSVFACIRDPIIPIKLAAEKAFLSVFNLVEDIEMTQFHEWFDSKTEINTITGTSIVPRSIGDYTKRVASRLAGVERERIEAGGDEETMFSDRFEDENEVWAVGGIEIAPTS